MARVLGSYPIGRVFESHCRYHTQSDSVQLMNAQYGPLVKWSRRRPFTAQSWVRLPYGSPTMYLANAYFTAFASSFFAQFLHLPLICHLFLKIATYTATCASARGSFLFPKESALVIASQFLAFASWNIWQ